MSNLVREPASAVPAEVVEERAVTVGPRVDVLELRLQTLEIDLGSLRSCTPASRDFRRDQGELSPDWGPFGFIAAEFAGPPYGILLINDFDLSNGGWVAGASGGRNPDWAPPSFHWSCSASAPD